MVAHIFDPSFQEAEAEVADQSLSSWPAWFTELSSRTNKATQRLLGLTTKQRNKAD